MLEPNTILVNRTGRSLAAVFVLAIASLAARVFADGPTAPASAQTAPAPAPVDTARRVETAERADKIDYSSPKAWLCRPGRRGACAVDLTTTVVSAAGKLQREIWSANSKAQVDCFYVYPTVSSDPTLNSDMLPGPEEKLTVQSQFARFASQCRPYAPLYRQTTVASIRAANAGNSLSVERALSYNDVRDAWNYYLTHDNRGRGVVLIGHSQGSAHLMRLLREEIEAMPSQALLVSALLVGAQVTVPKGRDVGGSFQQLPLCRSPGQTGCVIAYASFRANAPPPADSRFGRVDKQGLVSACTNPAALSGGSAPLHAYLRTRGRDVSLSTKEPGPWLNTGRSIQTPFVSVPGLLSAECLANSHGAYLSILVKGDPDDPRADDIVGDVVVDGQVRSQWGLHVVDMHLAMGNLVDIVSQQAKAYLAMKRGAQATTAATRDAP